MIKWVFVLLLMVPQSVRAGEFDRAFETSFQAFMQTQDGKDLRDRADGFVQPFIPDSIRPYLYLIPSAKSTFIDQKLSFKFEF